MPMARCVHFRAVYDDIDPYPLKGRLVPVIDASEGMSGMGESGMRDGHDAARRCRAMVRGCGVSDGHRVGARHSGVYFLSPQRGLTDEGSDPESLDQSEPPLADGNIYLDFCPSVLDNAMLVPSHATDEAGHCRQLMRREKRRAMMDPSKVAK